MSTKNKNIALFSGQQIRRVWDKDKELWFFSVSDVIAVLTESIDPTAYWRKLKQRLLAEGSNETVTKCHGLKMTAPDGKMRLTDVADTETLLRLIQSIPSPKAEPFKLWLAKVGYQRLEETIDPELAINRGLKNYLRLGYSRDWINQRIKSIEVRKALTDEWEQSGVKEGLEFALLTDELTKTWSGLTTKQYKQFKNLKKENLRDNMTNLELVLNMLAETATTQISQNKNPKGFTQSKDIVHQGGTIAKNARQEIEQKSGKPVLVPKNAIQLGIRKNIKRLK